MTRELARPSAEAGPVDYLGRHRKTGGAVPAHAAVGDAVAGRYELTERLTPLTRRRFLAYDTTLNRSVELSLVDTDSHLSERLRGSASVTGLSSITHPALETIYDVGHDTRLGQSYLVTESSPTRTLAEAGRGTLSAVQARSVFLQLLDVLASLHAAGLGHHGLTAAGVRLLTPDATDDPAQARCLLTLDGVYRFAADKHPGRGPADDLRDLGMLARQHLGPFPIDPAGTQRPIASRDWQQLMQSLIDSGPGAGPTAAELRDTLTTGNPLPHTLRTGPRPSPAGRPSVTKLHNRTKGVS